MIPLGSEARALRAIRQLSLVRALEDDLWERLIPHISIRKLDTDENLFVSGDYTDQLYLVLDGEIGLYLHRPDEQAPYFLETRKKGDTAGDFSVLNGVAHLVTAKALKPTQLACLPRSAFELLVNVDQQVLRHVYDTAADLSHRVLLARVYISLFGDIPTDRMDQLLTETQVTHVEPGESLFLQGQEADGLHIIVSGRVNVETTDADGNRRLIAEVGSNEIIGEFALLTEASRSASVYATRQSIVAMLNREKFQEIMLKNSDMVAAIARLIVKRQMELASQQQVVTSDQNFVIVPLDRKLPLRRFVQQLKLELSHEHNPLILDKASFEILYGTQNASATPYHDVSNSSIVGWMDDRESYHSHVVYVTDPTWTQWTARCIKRADRILLLANAEPGSNSQCRVIEERLKDIYQDAHYKPRIELVLLHPSDTESPAGTHTWLEPRKLDAFHHVRNGDRDHIARIARRMTGTACGLVLSGGGARGFAHLGVQRSIEERRIDIDYLCGSSMGGLLAGAMAKGLDYKEVLELCGRFANKRALYDYTLPMSALMKSEKLTRFCRHVYGNTRIEDLWVPFFCVSSNLATGEEQIHQSGFLWEAIRSTISLPGIFSPVPIPNGQLLIDGAVLNTFPVDVMLRKLAGGVIIGSNVSQIDEVAERYSYGSSLSGWQAFFTNLNPFSPRIPVPRIAETLLRSTDIKGMQRLNETRSQLDILIEPDIADFPLLAFKSYRKISEVGYQAAEQVFSTTTITNHR